MIKNKTIIYIHTILLYFLLHTKGETQQYNDIIIHIIFQTVIFIYV